MMPHTLFRSSFFFSISRNIHTTNALTKLRDIALLRYMRKKRPPYHKEKFIYDDFVMKPYDYPEPLPEFPPGNWGNIHPDTAWKW